MKRYCHHWNSIDPPPDCECWADDNWIMRFDDIGQEPIYLCASCGARSRKLEVALKKAFDERGSDFLEEFREAIELAESEIVKH